MLFARPAPLGALLPSARLLVHHGGIGTAFDGLRAVTPQWLFPTAHDQADNADRLCQLGVARAFRADVPERDLREAARRLPAGRQDNAVDALRARLQSAPDASEQVADWACDDLDALRRYQQDS